LKESLGVVGGGSTVKFENFPSSPPPLPSVVKDNALRLHKIKGLDRQHKSQRRENEKKSMWKTKRKLTLSTNKAAMNTLAKINYQ